MTAPLHDEPAVPTEDAPGHGKQSLAIGLYIGSIIVIIGLLLTGYGAFGGPQLNQDGSSINKDLLWGAVMAIFGLITLALAWFSPRRRAPSAHQRAEISRPGQGFAEIARRLDEHHGST